MRGHMKKRLLILLMIFTTLFTVSSCGQSEPLVKFDEGSGLFITYGFVPVDAKNTQIISTAVNNSDYEITDLKVTYGIKDSSHTIEESTDSVNSKSSRDLSKVTQSYVHSLDAVSYTHLDVYKRQVLPIIHGNIPHRVCCLCL